MYFYAAVAYLGRILNTYSCDIVQVHRKKLSALYGANVFMPSVDSNIINLSDYTVINLSEDETSLLNRLGFGVKRRVSTILLQVQMEKLYMSILDHKNLNHVTIVNSEHQNTKLKSFGIKHQPVEHSNPLPRGQEQALRLLRRNEAIVIQLPDKGGGVVVMNVTDYDSKVHELVSDPSKFTHTDAKQNDKVKVKINKIANYLKISHPAHFCKTRRRGDYNNGNSLKEICSTY